MNAQEAYYYLEVSTVVLAIICGAITAGVFVVLVSLAVHDAWKRRKK